MVAHIGKTIFRDDNGCSCEQCVDVLKNGLLVIDKEHAKYVAMTTEDYLAEGIDLNYRDKP